MKFPPTTSHECLLRNHWDLGSYGGRKECLSKTRRPGFVSTVRPDLPVIGVPSEFNVILVVYYESIKRDLQIKPIYESTGGGARP